MKAHPPHIPDDPPHIPDDPPHIPDDPSVSSPGSATGTLPMVIRDESLPDRATVYEVGPRDGLQNESATIDSADIVTFLGRLTGAGLPVVAATSFVHHAWVIELAAPAVGTAGV